MAVREVSDRIIFPVNPLQEIQQELNSSILHFVDDEPDVNRIMDSWKNFCLATNRLIRQRRRIHSRYMKAAVFHSGKVYRG
jgi:hypothetical protein